MSSRLQASTLVVLPGPSGLAGAGTDLRARVKSRLVERSADLKRALLEFARQPAYSRELRRARDRYLGRRTQPGEAELGNFLDYFVLQHRLASGRTLMELFVAAHPALAEAEREMLLGWTDVVEGLFEVQRREGEALVLTNLLDELTYHARSNQGASIFRAWPPGSFLHARLVPLGNEWLFSGYVLSYPPSERDRVFQLAARTAMRNPALVFRNPQKLDQAWDLQRKARRTFIDFFGSEQVVLPGSDLAERMDAYLRFCIYEDRDGDGRSPADRVKEESGIIAPVPRYNLPDALLQAETVGVVYDDVDGLTFLAGFGLIEQTFTSPELAARARHKEAVLDYLKDESIPPSVFRRLAARGTEQTNRVFCSVLGRPHFHWQLHGEALLRKHKAAYFQRTPRPRVIPLSTELARAQMSAQR